MTQPLSQAAAPRRGSGKRTPLAVWCKSLGCPKNRVDTETFLGGLGVPIRRVESIKRARLVFINTCGFITPAVRESIQSILEAAREASGAARRPLLAVAGCMVGRYGTEELAAGLPEVDVWLPTSDLPFWSARIRERLGLDGPEDGARIISTPPSYAWVKVAEGCRHRCAFCTIPTIRGPLRSLPEDVVEQDARRAVAGGAKELILIAQDLTDYGRDLNPGREGLPPLLERLSDIEGLFWLRMLYLYPRGITPALLDTIRRIGRPVLPYFDIPLQHSHPDVLKSMGRPFSVEPEAVCSSIRDALPDAALRTTLIVGYPGETEAHFEHLCRFVEKMKFNHLGVFTFWPEEGSAAAALPDQLPQEVKDRRRDTIMEIQKDISRDSLEPLVGTADEVLVDTVNPEWPGLHYGRVWFQAPEIDGQTYVSGPGVAPGAMVKADIVESGDYDLTALAQE